MKKTLILIVLATMIANQASAQKFFTRVGVISFYSDAPLEKIEAINNTAMAVLDTETGNFQFALLIKAFQFEKALMQEHFNENYMESDHFPKAIFKGKIKDASNVNWKKDGEYSIVVSGNLTLHGETQEVEAKGSLFIKGDTIKAHTVFKVAVADYAIKIPSVVGDNIAKTVDVTVDIEMNPLVR